MESTLNMDSSRALLFFLPTQNFFINHGKFNRNYSGKYFRG